MRDIDNMVREHILKHKIGYITLTTFIVLGLIFLAIIIDRSSNYIPPPIVERVVDSTLVKDRYTECLFIVDGKRYVTTEYPCLYHAGEKVNTQISGGYLKIVD